MEGCGEQGEGATDVVPNGIDLVQNRKVWVGTKEMNTTNKSNH